MKYLCLLYADESGWFKATKSETEQAMALFREFGEWAKKGGHVLGSNRLHPTHTATTLRTRNGKLSTTDGPFAETKEQLGGYYLIEAKDLNEAIQVASRIPGVQWGSVEVRPIWEAGAPEIPRPQ